MEKTFLLVEYIYIYSPVKKYSRKWCPSFSNVLKNLFVEIEKFKLYCWNAKLAEEGELKLRMSRGEELIYVY